MELKIKTERERYRERHTERQTSQAFFIKVLPLLEIRQQDGVKPVIKCLDTIFVRRMLTLKAS